jgi:hypothetical protein
MTQPNVTAVGRILKPKHGEPRKHQVIKIGTDGGPYIVIDKILDEMTTATVAD